jgi:hypothetical protein
MPCHAIPGILFGSELSSASARNTSLARIVVIPRQEPLSWARIFCFISFLFKKLCSLAGNYIIRRNRVSALGVQLLQKST